MKLGSDLNDYIGSGPTKIVKKENNLASNDQILHKKKSIDIEIEITKKDIFDWIMACDDPAVLKHLSRTASFRAKSIEDPQTNPPRK